MCNGLDRWSLERVHARNLSCRNPRNRCVRGNVLCYNGARRDDSMRSDLDPRKDNGVDAHERISAYPCFQDLFETLSCVRLGLIVRENSRHSCHGGRIFDCHFFWIEVVDDNEISDFSGSRNIDPSETVESDSQRGGWTEPCRNQEEC